MAKDDHRVYGSGPGGNSPKQISQQITQQHLEISGPLPQSGEFARYEVTLPGAANRILAMAEREAVHRQGLDAKMVDANIRQSGIGQWLGFTCVLVSCALIGFGIYKGSPLSFIPGTITGLASLVAVFTNIGKNPK